MNASPSRDKVKHDQFYKENRAKQSNKQYCVGKFYSHLTSKEHCNRCSFHFTDKDFRFELLVFNKKLCLAVQHSYLKTKSFPENNV